MVSPSLPDEFALLADNAAEAGLPWAGPPPVRRDAVPVGGGRRLSALVWGDGPPEAVLLHGGAQNAHTWDTVVLALARPVVALDLPGHGHSDWREDHEYGPDNLAADVALAIDALAPDAPLVVGMSLGGLTSLALTRQRPDLVRRLFLVDITPGVNADKARAITEFVSGPEHFDSYEAMVERTVAHHPDRSESSLRRGVLHNAHETADGSWSWRWDPVRRAGGVDAAVGEMWGAVSAYPGPLTLARGGVSPVVDDDDVAEFRRRRPDATVVVVEGAGHSIQGDRPVELAVLLGEALDR